MLTVATELNIPKVNMAKRKKVTWDETWLREYSKGVRILNTLQYPERAPTDELVTALIDATHWVIHSSEEGFRWSYIQEQITPRFSRDELEKYRMRDALADPINAFKSMFRRGYRNQRRYRAQIETDTFIVSYEHVFGSPKEVPINQVWDFYNKETGRGRKIVQWNIRGAYPKDYISYQMNPSTTDIWRLG